MEQNIDENEAQTVGELLRNARLKKGMTLSDVSADLCIRKSYLNAIENMDFANMPPMPFGIGFVRSYADYIGLNGDRIVSSYRQALLPVQENKANNEENEVTNPHSKHLLIALIGFILLFCAWYYQIPDLLKSPKEEIEVENTMSEPLIVADNDELVTEISPEIIEQTEEQMVASEESEDNVSNSNEQYVTESENKLQEIKLVLNNNSWIELKHGNKIILSGVYKKGFTYNISQEKGLTISVGRPNSVKFFLGDNAINVVSSSKRKNVSLDSFFNTNKTEMER